MARWTGSTASVHGTTVHWIDLHHRIKTEWPYFNETEGVCPLLILAAQKQMDSQHGWRRSTGAGCHMRRRHERLTGLEPSAGSGGYFLMRSSPTCSTG
jgi:hypothetical protein